MTPRGFRGTFTFDVPIDRVWQALTDAERLTECFATDAEIVLVPGGPYSISWFSDWAWPFAVREVLPHRTLRLAAETRPFDAHGRPVDTAPAVELILEFHLEDAGDRTLLTIVHSGFGEGQGWDDELEGVTAGWQVEAHVLGHYLRHHFGRPRHQAWVRHTADRTATALWRWLMTPGIIFTDTAALDAAAGPIVAPFVTGDTINGRVLFAIPGRHVLIEMVAPEELRGGLLDITVHHAAGQSLAQVVLSSWSEHGHPVVALGARLQDVFNRHKEERS